MSKIQQHKTVALNDRFRKGESSLGVWSTTPKVRALPEARKQALFRAVQSVDNFVKSPPVNLSAEHDTGIVTQDDTDYLWEIDYCNKSLTAKSPNPADPDCTARILTLMRVDEY